MVRLSFTRCMYLCALLLLTQSVNAQESEGIVGRLNLGEQITLAGYPNADHRAEIKESGALVIDLRTAEEQTAEAPGLEQHGLEVVHLPIGREPLARATVEKFESTLQKAAYRNVWLHCSSGNRAGLLWAARRIDQGTDVDTAIAEVRSIATREETIVAIRAYAAQSR